MATSRTCRRWRSAPAPSGASAFLSAWTIFYWAWWISWTPFVGMFIARISKGRTIRQFVVYVILVPSLVSFVWFSILAGAAFDLQLEQGVKRPRGGTGERGHGERRSSTRCGSTRCPAITVVLAVFLIAIFFITGADSASIVMGMLSQHGKEEPMRWLVIFWGVAPGCGRLGAPLVTEGSSALQTLVIIVAGPFMLIIDRDVRVADEGAARRAGRHCPRSRAVLHAQDTPRTSSRRAASGHARAPRRTRHRPTPASARRAAPELGRPRPEARLTVVGGLGVHLDCFA